MRDDRSRGERKAYNWICPMQSTFGFAMEPMSAIRYLTGYSRDVVVYRIAEGNLFDAEILIYLIF